MNFLEYTSLTFGFIGCFFVILSFLFQLHGILNVQVDGGVFMAGEKVMKAIED